ncbi:MAG: hypothetical protein ACFB16_27010 [Phormidesmis sp.]
MTAYERTADVPKFPVPKIPVMSPQFDFDSNKVRNDKARNDKVQNDKARQVCFNISNGILISSFENAEEPISVNTGSKLLDALNNSEAIAGNATTLFNSNNASNLGLQNIELPTLKSTPLSEIKVRGTAREQAVSRMARVLRADRNMTA